MDRSMCRNRMHGEQQGWPTAQRWGCHSAGSKTDLPYNALPTLRRAQGDLWAAAQGDLRAVAQGGYRRVAGFSLIELLVVIIVIGILTSVAMQSMDVAIEDARRVKTEREMAMLSKAIAGDPSVTNGRERSDFGYVGDVGAFPPNLSALASNPGGWSTWDGPYIPAGFSQDTLGFKIDEWGKPYSYVGGTSISSSGGGSVITHKVADAVDDYLRNRVMGTVRDVNDSIPGDTYCDSVSISITVPNGSGGRVTKTYHPNASGGFVMDSLPAGTHPLSVVFVPEADTLFRNLTVLPRHRGSVSYQFAEAHFGSVGGHSPTVDTLLVATFASSSSGFTYQDDAFRGTSQPSYASGTYVASGGITGGGIRVTLGGVDNADILGMSGGWRRTFTLNQAALVTLSVQFNLTQSANYESNEYSQTLVSVDGVLKGISPNDYVAQINGNGNGGGQITTGWTVFQVELGTLSAGPHTLRLGGYNNGKTDSNENTRVVFDDVLVTAR
jgi:prepilin-type N-terminal cleavage/methylation domain-containing protein